ncbi:MAG: hypothetical protein QM758_25875 [Armatimonas sp.]
MRSTDGGTTWTNVTPAGVTSLGRGWGSVRVFNQYNRPRTTGVRPYFATCEGAGVFRSDDRGATWTKIDAPLRFNNGANGGSNQYSLYAQPSPYKSNVVYILDVDGRFSDGRIFRGELINGVYRWTDVTGTFPTMGGSANNYLDGGLAGALAASPIQVADANDPFVILDTDLVYAGIGNLASAFNGGPGWTTLSGTSVIGRVQAVKYDPFNGANQFTATDTGVYGVRYDVDNASWSYQTSINRTLGVTQFFQASFHPTDSTRVIGGASLVGVVLSNGDLNNWQYLGGRWGVAGIFNPSKPAEQYAIIRAAPTGGWQAWNIFYTSNNWASNLEVSPGQNFQGPNGTIYLWPWQGNTDSSVGGTFNGQTQPVTPTIAVDPNTATVAQLGSGNVAVNPMYIGTNALWRFDPPPGTKRTTDPVNQIEANGQWRQVGTTTFDGVVSAIAIGSGGGALYVGTTTGKVYVSAVSPGINMFTGRQTDPTTGNLTTTWLNISSNLPAGPITDISINPLNAADILLTQGGTGHQHIWRCQDTLAGQILYTPQDGLNPADLTSLPDVPFNGITRDPQDPVNTWYVSSDAGVFATQDKGSNWYDATVPLGLPAVKTTSIRANSVTGFLNVATYGRGAWRFNLATAVEQAAESVSVGYLCTKPKWKRNFLGGNCEECLWQHCRTGV